MGAGKQAGQTIDTYLSDASGPTGPPAAKEVPEHLLGA